MNMTHDFSEVFETDNEYWKRVLEIFANNEKYPKKKVTGRHLHHKFPRSFSKKLNQDVDNDKDNLISLSPSDHFKVHYYYYILAKKGYRQAMALAFHLMVRTISKQMSPETMEECAADYDRLAREAVSHNIHERSKFWKDHPEEHKEWLSNVAKAQQSVEVRKRKSKSMKGKNAGSNNGMYGKSSAMKDHSCTDWMTEEEIIKWKESISKSNKGRKLTEEQCKAMSERMKINNPQSRRYSWKNDNGGFNNIVIPDYIQDAEISDIRKALKFLWGDASKRKDWRSMVLRLIKILKMMDSCYSGSLIIDKTEDV